MTRALQGSFGRGMRRVLAGAAGARAHMTLAAALAAAVAAPALSAQSIARDGVSFVIAPAAQRWSFADAVPLDSLLVRSASQLSVPFALQLPFASRWSASLTGGVARSTLDARSSTGTVTRTLTGLTDLRVRATGRVFGDAVQLTFGVNVPTGTVGLSPAENDVLRVVSAPALEAQVPVVGIGLGGTIGAVFARNIGSWGWAAGAAVEQRGRYTPFEAQIAGFDASAELVSGQALHLSLGADGLVGGARLTMGLVGDLYGKDRVRLIASGNEVRNERYQLGPTMSANVALQVNNARVRDLTFRLTNRYRSAFNDANGAAVDGSSGNYFDLGASGLIGSPGRTALLLGADFRQHTGLAVDQGFIGAGVTAFGATIGASIPSAALEWRPSVRASVGTLRTALISTNFTGVTVGLTVNAR